MHIVRFYNIFIIKKVISPWAYLFINWNMRVLRQESRSKGDNNESTSVK